MGEVNAVLTVDSDRENLSTTTIEKTNKKKQPVSSSWKLAESLCPDTEALAHGSLAGDEQSLAVLTIWQFRQNIGTTVCHVPALPKEAETRISIRKHEIHAEGAFTTLVRAANGCLVEYRAGTLDALNAALEADGFIFQKARAKDEECSGKDAPLPKSPRVATDGTWQLRPHKTKAAAKVCLNLALEQFKANREDGSKALWMALYDFAVVWCRQTRQKDLWKVGREKDFVHDLTMHCFAKTVERLDAAEQTPELGPYVNWLSVTCYNASTDALVSTNKLKKIVSILPGSSPGEGECEAEKGCMYADQISDSEEAERAAIRRDKARLSERVSAALATLDNDADRAYASLLMMDLKQKEAAAQMPGHRDGKTGESAVTARKREGRIGEALRKAGFGREVSE